MGDDAQSERRKRLADALRANLKRRKAQERERSAAPEDARGKPKTTKETG